MVLGGIGESCSEAQQLKARFTRARKAASATARSRLGWLLGLLLLGLLLVGCAGTGSYPLDIFYEMHYSQSDRPGEPPRVEPPADAVPVTGKSPTRMTVGFGDAANLASPLPDTGANRARGYTVFVTNCSMCHGVNADGQSVVADRYAEAKVAPPPAFASVRVKARQTGQIVWVVTNGLGNMPAFGKLLTEEERWAVALCVRAVATTERPPQEACR